MEMTGIFFVFDGMRESVCSARRHGRAFQQSGAVLADPIQGGSEALWEV